MDTVRRADMSSYTTSSAVIYMRLSNDDQNNESLSITNQRSILQNYCLEHRIEIVREFVDDGWSGGNFDRPGFRDMLAFLEKNRVDRVITKDLSRLGRDMTEASFYAERYFPEHGIRYLAINDNFDSFEDNMMAPFQFAMNDVYIRETSRKIRSVLTQKKKSGKYCACPPYGYRKSPSCRDQLIPDEETAPFVRMIFAKASAGESAYAITKMLNDIGAIPPLKYRVIRDQFSEKGASHASNEWNISTVKRIIRNQVYTGDTLLGKTKKTSPKSTAKKEVPVENWYITENTHEPLVSREDFAAANDTLNHNTRRHSDQLMKNGGSRSSIFRGLVFCKNCGAAMCSGGTVYRGEYKSYWYLTCRNIPKSSSHPCENGARIKYYTLMELIRNELNILIDLSDTQIDAIIQNLRQNDMAETQNAVLRKQIAAVQAEMADSDKIIEKLYRDNIAGKLSDERLENMVASLDGKSEQLKEKLASLESQIHAADSQIDRYENFFAIVKNYSHIEELTPEILHAFIDRIEIGPASVKRARKQPITQEVCVYYKFIGTGDYLKA